MFGTKAVKGAARFLPAFVGEEEATDRSFLVNLPLGVLSTESRGLLLGVTTSDPSASTASDSPASTASDMMLGVGTTDSSTATASGLLLGVSSVSTGKTSSPS